MSKAPTISSQSHESSIPQYPLNSFSGTETAIKTGAIVLALLFMGGVVAITFGGQSFLPEIFMASTSQMIIQSYLGLASICLIVEVAVYSVKETPPPDSNEASDSEIIRAKLASVPQLVKDIKKGQQELIERTADRDLLAKQLEDLELKHSKLRNDHVAALENAKKDWTIKLKDLSAAIDKSQKVNADLQAQISKAEEEHRAQLKALSGDGDMAQKIANLTAEHEKQKKSLEDKLAQVTLEHEAKIKELTEAREVAEKQELTNLQKKHEEEIKKLNTEQGKAIEEYDTRIKDLNLSITQTKDKHETELVGLKQEKEDIETQLTELQKKYDEEKKNLEAQVAQLKKSQEESQNASKQALEKLKLQHAEDINKLIAKHEKENKDVDEEYAIKTKELTQAKEKAENKLSVLQKQYDELESLKQKLEITVQENRGRILELEAFSKRDVKIMQELREDYEELKAHNTTVIEAYDNLKATITQDPNNSIDAADLPQSPNPKVNISQVEHRLQGFGKILPINFESDPSLY